MLKKNFNVNTVMVALFRNKCHQSKDNKVININRTLTSYHKEVIDNLAFEEVIKLRCTHS